jgi:hypothetical protein
MPTEIHYDKEHAETYLGVAVIAYSEALEAALKGLAETKGTDDLQWFDDLRAEMVRTAKGTITEQISIEVEAGALGDSDFSPLRRTLMASAAALQLLLKIAKSRITLS